MPLARLREQELEQAAAAGCQLRLLKLNKCNLYTVESDRICAFHGVSPRDRWLCVLPRWQMNVT